MAIPTVHGVPFAGYKLCHLECAVGNTDESSLLLIFGSFLYVLNSMLAAELLVVVCLLEGAPRQCHPGSRSKRIAQVQAQISDNIRFYFV